MPEYRPRVLVVGGARRVGRAIAHEFASRECDVTLTYNTSRTEAEATVAELAALGGQHAAVHLDLLNLQNVAAVGRLLAAENDWDALVLSASTYANSPLAEVTPARLLSDMTVNALAPVTIVQALAPALANARAPGGGSITAMLDIHALGRPRKDFLSYSMSKAALAEAVQTLARDLAPKVRVNGVAPGVVAWPESGNESERHAQQAYLSRVPLGRAGTPSEAANAVAWLALEATYVTGQIIRVDGGRSLA